MKKILIHVGLHKTATTSIQDNVFMQLHEDKKINFLGRSNEKSYFPFRDLFEKLGEKELSDSELNIISKEFDSLLLNDKLNVISDERFTGSAKNNANIIWRNFKLILVSYDVHILLSLRNPKDLIFSSYVQRYNKKYISDKNRNSFQKYLNHAYENRHSCEYNELFFHKIYKMFDEYKHTFVLYEDIKNDSLSYSTSHSKLLGISPDEFNRLFFKDEKNKKTKFQGGSFSDQITLINHVGSFKAFLLRRVPFLKYLMKLQIIKSTNNLINKLSRKVVIKKPMHFIPDNYDEQIERLVQSDNQYLKFIRGVGISDDKLHRYKYIK